MKTTYILTKARHVVTFLPRQGWVILVRMYDPALTESFILTKARLVHTFSPRQGRENILRKARQVHTFFSRQGSVVLYCPSKTRLQILIKKTFSPRQEWAVIHSQQSNGNTIHRQVHSLCVDSRPGDRSFFAKGPPSSLIPHHCVKHSLKLTGRLWRWL